MIVNIRRSGSTLLELNFTPHHRPGGSMLYAYRTAASQGFLSRLHFRPSKETELLLVALEYLSE